MKDSGAFFPFGQCSREVCHEGGGQGGSDVIRPKPSPDPRYEPFAGATRQSMHVCQLHGQIVSHICGQLLDTSSAHMWVFFAVVHSHLCLLSHRRLCLQWNCCLSTGQTRQLEAVDKVLDGYLLCYNKFYPVLAPPIGRMRVLFVQILRRLFASSIV